MMEEMENNGERRKVVIEGCLKRLVLVFQFVKRRKEDMENEHMGNGN